MKCFSGFVAATCAALLLAGCAGSVVRPATGYAPRPAASARVSFEVPATLRLRVSRPSFGSYSAPPIGREDIEYSQREVAEMLREARSQVPAAIESALRSNGIPEGDDVRIKVFVDEAGHNGMGPSAVMSVYAYYADMPAGSTPWNVKIVAATSAVDTPGTTAAKFAAKAVEQLVGAGIVKAR
jgi:hypothetical protein